jgi:hypothetical protein
MPPAKWPPGHRWVSEEDARTLTRVINCPECLEAIASKDVPIYTIKMGADGKEESITCLRCKRTSHHPEDVAKHYCGHCHAFLDDLWPPAKKWWLENPPPDKPEHA